jgi:superoxide dismutase, Fe-Mn family
LNCRHPLTTTLYFASDATASSRRAFFTKAAIATGFGVGVGASHAYTVPDLNYPFEALEPYIDAPTMKLHHDKHHATYVANVNKATEGKPEKPILDLMENALDAGAAVRNNGGGHYNHAFFWDEMAPASTASATKPSAQLMGLIEKKFGSLDEMKAQFEAKAAPGATFGSGWVWLCVKKDGSLEIVNSPNQDNPLMKGVASEIMVRADLLVVIESPNHCCDIASSGPVPHSWS